MANNNRFQERKIDNVSECGYGFVKEGVAGETSFRTAGWR